MTQPRRSPHWKTARRLWLRDHSSCAACGGRLFRQVHHIVPFHIDRTLELDGRNLITLCELPFRNCHFHVGHNGNWAAWNATVAQDAARLLEARLDR